MRNHSTKGRERYTLSGILSLCVLMLFSFYSYAQNTQYIEGKIRVKVDEETAALLYSARQNQQNTGLLQIDHPALKSIFNQCNVSNVSRVFPYNEKFEEKHKRHGLHLWYQVDFDQSTSVSQAVSLFQQFGGARVAEPVLKKKIVGNLTLNWVSASSNQLNLLSLTTDPDDPFYGDQWHYNNTGQSGGTPGADIDLPQAWNIETGSSDVIVAVTDGGIDIAHEDIVDNLWVNEDEIPDNGIDDDGNGYIDDIHGYGFGDDSPTIPADAHGTHVGGTVAATTNNGVGVAGVAGGSGVGDGIRLMSCASFGQFNVGNFAQSYIYAADNGAVISQNSWGYTSPGIFEQAVLDAIDYFIAEAGYDELGNPVGPMQGGIVIFAAGNDGSFDDYYPGFYDPVLAVGGTDHNDDEYISSNRGDWVDIAAPAVNVLSTLPGNSYGSFSGTSMACPHVSGAAALIISKFSGNITPQQLRDRLVLTTDPLPGLEFLGSGRLNAFNALQENDGIAPEPITDLTVSEQTLSSITLNWTSPLDQGNGSASLYDIRYADFPITADNFGTATSVENVPSPQVAGQPEIFTIEGLEPSTMYYVAIISEDFFGNASGISNVISTTTLDPPVINVEPLSLTEDLMTGETSEQTLSISNTGSGPLEVNLTLGGTVYNVSAATTSGRQVKRKSINYETAKVPIRAFTGISQNGQKNGVGQFSSPLYETSFEDLSLGDIDGQGGWSGSYSDWNISNVDPTDGFQHLASTSATLPAGASFSLALSPSVATGVEDFSSLGVKVRVPGTGVTWEVIPQSNSEGFVNTRIRFNPDKSVSVLDANVEDFVNIGYTIPNEYFDIKLLVNRSTFEFTLFIDNEEVYSGLGYAANIEQAVFLSNMEVEGEAFHADELVIQDGMIDTYPFLSVNPGSAIIEGGESLEITVGFDANGLFGGVYENEIRIDNNDPTAGRIIVPVTMNVTGTGSPVIGVDTTSLSFENTFVGDTSSATLVVNNQGTEILQLSEFVVSSGDFLIDQEVPVIVEPFEEVSLTVYFTPQSVGELNGTLSITSNDPENSVLDINLDGAGTNPPVAVVSPESLSETLEQGLTSTQTLNLTNNGEADLDFSLSVEDGVSASANISIDLPVPVAGNAGQSLKQRSSHPEPIQDYSANNVGLTAGILSVLIISPDDDVTDVEAILDGFPDLQADVYEKASLPEISITDLEGYDVVLTTNNTQWLSSGSVDPEIIGDLLADYLDSGGKVIVNNFAYDYAGWEMSGRFIDENYGPFTGTTTDFFGTVELGEIAEPGHPIMEGVSSLSNGYLWQDHTVADDATLIASWSDGSAFLAVKDNVVGFNLLPSDGNGIPGWSGDLPLIYHNAIIWLAGSGVITAEPTEGTVPVGVTMPITVTFDALEADAGLYSKSIEIVTNDPLNKIISVPVELNVLPPPISVTPSEIFAEAEKGNSTSEQITISNSGDEGLGFVISIDGESYDVYNSLHIVGTATGQGWESFINMDQNASNPHLWMLESFELEDGEIKFAANESLDVNWGAEDFPMGYGTQDGANITVPAGTYDIYFNSASGEYLFFETSSETTVASQSRSSQFSGEELVLDAKAFISGEGVTRYNTSLYFTDFEEFALGDINGQLGWSGQFANWQISADNPYGTGQYMESVSDGFGQTLAFSPAVSLGEEEVTTLSVDIGFTDIGVTWQLIPQSTSDELVVTRIQVNTAGEIQALVDDGAGGTSFVSVGLNISEIEPPANLQLIADKNTAMFEIVIDGVSVFEGQGFSGKIEQVVLLSLMEVFGPTLGLDNMEIIDGLNVDIPDYLQANPVAGVVPAGGESVVELNYDASELDFGYYNNEVAVEILNAANTTFNVPSTFYVSGPPSASVDPTVILEEVDYGTGTVSPLMIKNDGGSDLEYQISVIGADLSGNLTTGITIDREAQLRSDADRWAKYQESPMKDKWGNKGAQSVAMYSGDELLTADFEDSDFPPSNWEVVDNEGTGLVWGFAADYNTDNYCGSGEAATVNSDEVGFSEYDTELITPAIEVAGRNDVVLQFSANFFRYSTEIFDVDISTDGGANWTNILRWEESHGTPFDLPGEVVAIELDEWLTDAETLKIRWHYYNPESNDWDWYAQIDDVQVTAQSNVWLKVDPVSGTVPLGEEEEIEVQFDASQLDPGQTVAGIIVETNDSSNPVIGVVAGLTVREPAEITVTPTEFMEELVGGTTSTTSMEISNSGESILLYDIVGQDFEYNFELNTHSRIIKAPRSEAYQGELIDKMSVTNTKVFVEQNFDDKLYATDFELMSVGDINGQEGWFGQFGNWTVDISDPNQGFQHFYGLSDGLGQSIAASPVVSGDEDITSISMMMNVEGSDVSWWITTESVTDGLINTRLIINPDRSLEIVYNNGSGGAIIEAIDAELPEGYFNLMYEVEKSTGITTIYFDGEKVFSGLGFSAMAEVFVVLSQMEVPGPSMSIDNFIMYDGVIPPDYLDINPAAGMVMPGASVNISVTFDATELSGGQYEQPIMVLSNDPANSMVSVPTYLTVIDPPVISVSPESIEEEMVVGEVKSEMLTIANEGVADLVFSFVDNGLLNVTEQLAAQKSELKERMKNPSFKTKYNEDRANSAQAELTSSAGFYSGDTLLTEKFEGEFPPTGWVSLDNEGNGVEWLRSDDWSMGNFAGSGFAAAVNSDAFGNAEFDAELRTPSINVSGLVGLVLEYNANYQNYLNLDFLNVDISTDGGNSWTTMLSWNEDHGGFLALPGEFVSIELDPFVDGAEEIMIRWHYFDPNTGDWDWYAQIDDVTILSAGKAWVSVAPSAGTIAGGEEMQIEVTMDGGSLEEGSHNHDLIIANNDLTSPEKIVPVSAVVLPQCSADGTLYAEYWYDVKGKEVNDIPTYKYPSDIVPINSMASPENKGSKYGTRIRSVLCAPETGEFKFMVAGNDNCELWLSTDENPDNKVLVASVPGRTQFEEFDKYPEQISAPIMLQKGRSYYIEVLHKEQSGKDHLTVGWQLPNGAMEYPISSEYFSSEQFTVLASSDYEVIYPHIELEFYKGDWKRLPDFQSIVPEYEGIAKSLNLNYAWGQDEFAMVFNGIIEVPETGKYEFSLGSDDGSKLYINGIEVIDNDRAQAMNYVSNTVSLESGYHSFKVEYFERRGEEGLELLWGFANNELEIVPSEVLYSINPPIIHKADIISSDDFDEGLKYDYFEQFHRNLDDFDLNEVVKSGVSTGLNIDERDATNGFMFDFDGYVHVPIPGYYTFYLESDDGSNLDLSSQESVLRINNDELHSTIERQMTAYLEAGYFRIDAQYFEFYGNQVLNLFWEGPGVSKQLIPESAYFYMPEDEGTTYARLADGTIEQESTNVIDPSIYLYPIPTDNRIFLELESGQSERLDMKLISVHGAITDLGSVDLQAGVHQLDVEIKSRGVKPGLYLLNIQSDSRNETRRIIVR